LILAPTLRHPASNLFSGREGGFEEIVFAVHEILQQGEPNSAIWKIDNFLLN
jgi:hypothetical protein